MKLYETNPTKNIFEKLNRLNKNASMRLDQLGGYGSQHILYVIMFNLTLLKVQQNTQLIYINSGV